MRKFLLLCLAFSFFIHFDSKAQKKGCETNCFSTIIKSAEETADGCFKYELIVSYSGDCSAALSHFSVETSCGNVTSLSNSMGWKQEISVTDPTTGISGFKIDDINGFGEEEGAGSFTVNVTICPGNEECAKTLSCWSPVVAYKAGQCVFYDSLTTECKKLEASLSSVNPSCAGSTDGQIVVNIIDGQEPFSFLWSNGSTNQQLNDLGSGEYEVTVKDASGAEIILSTTLFAPSPITLEKSVLNPDCAGIANGSITVQATGGTGSYSYNWSTGATGNTLLNLTAGSYTVTVIDSSGCSINETIILENKNQLLIEGVTTKASCSQSDGSIDLSVSGTADYTVTWLDGATIEDRSNLAPGFYTVTVTDINGCSSSRTFSIKEDNPLTLSGTIIPTGCPDDQTGGVNLTVSGYTGSLTYSWSNGATTANLTGVGAGRYEVTVNDNAGCSVTKAFYVFAKTIDVQSSVNQPSCSDAADASITLSSTENITVSWSDGAVGTAINGLGEGLYIATVTNDAGCTSTFSYFIDAPDVLSYSATITNPTCDAGGYSVEVLPTGGTGSYVITWSDGTTGLVKSNISEGNYSFSLTDSQGCSITGEITVNAEAAGCTDNPDDSTDDPTDNPDGSTDNPDDSTDNPDTDNPDDNNTDDPDSGNNPDDGSDDGNSDGDDTNNDGSDGDNDGGSDDGNNDGGSGDDNNPDKECSDPFNIEFSYVNSGDCIVLQGHIIYSGEASYGLSHATISPSCGSISGTYTENGQFENGLDPTTGLDGIKIDEIKGFGEGDNLQTLSFELELCGSDCLTGDSLSLVVAYKYGQCVSMDTINISLPGYTISANAYPNPTSDWINFKLDQPAENTIQVQLYNSMGMKVRDQLFDTAEEVKLDVKNLPNDLYTYTILSGGFISRGKVIVSK